MFSISGLVLLCTAVSLVGAVLFLTQALTDRATTEMHHTLTGVQGYLDNQRSDLLGTAHLVADDSVVRREVTTGNTPALVVHLTPFYADLNADVLDVIDARGRVVVRMEDTHTSGDKATGLASVRSALSGHEVVVAERDVLKRETAGGYALRASVPVLNDGRVVGVVVVGRQLGSIFASRIGHALDANVNIIAGARRTGTTLTDRNGLPEEGVLEPQSILSRIAHGSVSVATVKGDSGTVLSGIVPLQGDSGASVGAVEIVRPLGPIYDVIRSLSWLLLLLGAIVVAAGTVLALSLSRRLTSRLSVLESTASRVAAMVEDDVELGKLHVAEAVQGNDEVASLARSFAAMMTELDRHMADNARLYAASQARVRELTGLAEVARLLTAVSSVRETLDALGEHVCRLVGCEAVAIWLPEDGNVPALHGGHGLPKQYETLARKAFATIESPEFEIASQEALSSGEIIVRDLNTEPEEFRVGPRGELRQVLVDAGMQGATAIPLRLQNRIVGALSCYTAAPGSLQSAELNLLKTVADQVAVAVENARLAEEGQARAALQAALEERRIGEEAVRASEIRYRTMIEQSPLGIQIFAPDGTLVAINRAWADLFRLDESSIGVFNILHSPEMDALGVSNDVQRIFNGEATTMPPVKYDLPWVSVNGDEPEYRWLQAFGYALKDEDGRVREVIVMYQDITERLIAEEQLLEKEAQYRGIFEATSDALIIVDEHGKLVEVNPAACGMYGYPREELIGQQAMLDIPQVEATLEQVDAYRQQAVNRRKDGTSFDIEGRVTRLVYRGAMHYLIVARDVTEQVRAYEFLEQRVEERTRELSTLLEVSHNVASTLELQPLLSLILDQLRTVVDYSGAAILSLQGEHFIVLDRRMPNGLPLAGPESYSLQDSLMIVEELRHGTPVVVGDARERGPMADAYRHSLAEHFHTTFNFERSLMIVPLMFKDRMIGALSLSHAEPNFYTQSHAALVAAIASHAAVAIENARLYEQAQDVAVLEERQRLARELHDSVSQALYGIALGAKTARTLLDRDPSKVADPLEYVLSQAHAGLTEMRALIFELRPESLEAEGLVAALEKQAEALRARHGIEVHIETCAEPDVPMVIKEAMYRIAQEAMHNTLKHARARTLGLRFCTTGDGIELEISDDGAGFDTGGSFPGHLGLRTMRERALRLGGIFSVTSAPGEGTSILVRLPIAVDSTPAVRSQAV